MGRMTGWSIVAPLAILTILPSLASGDTANTITWAELRPRYNHIEESDKPETASGGTLRAVAGVRAGPWHGIFVTLEAIHADHWGRKRFNDDPARIASSPYPLLPDPRHTGVNRAHVNLTSLEGLVVRAGRQRVVLDNQRWVSDNDFRQVPQLFDGVTGEYTGIANTRLTGGHYTHIRTTSGVRQDARVTVLNAAWNPRPDHAVAAYAYLHDQPQTSNFTGFANNSYRVYGARAEGVATRWSGIELPYVVEVARQQPHAGGDERIDARYWRAGAGLATARWALRYDHEVRGSNDGLYGLQIPLTDFYAFNGWTLHWFTAARQGLRDGWVTGRAAVGSWTFYVELHRFRSDFGDLDFGREADLGVTWAIRPNALLRLQHARYDPGSGRADPEIRKAWLTFTWTY